MYSSDKFLPLTEVSHVVNPYLFSKTTMNGLFPLSPESSPLLTRSGGYSHPEKSLKPLIEIPHLFFRIRKHFLWLWQDGYSLEKLYKFLRREYAYHPEPQWQLWIMEILQEIEKE